MSWLKRILIGLAIVLVLLVGILFAIGFWTTDESSVTQTMSMTVGNRTVTVGGHYKEMTQESLADGINGRISSRSTAKRRCSSPARTWKSWSTRTGK